MPFVHIRYLKEHEEDTAFRQNLFGVCSRFQLSFCSAPRPFPPYRLLSRNKATAHAPFESLACCLSPYVIYICHGTTHITSPHAALEPLRLQKLDTVSGTAPFSNCSARTSQSHFSKNSGHTPPIPRGAPIHIASFIIRYFGKIFRQSAGKSLNEFIMERRLFAAKEMLIGSDMTIAHIAEQAGFCDAFYFSKCFKKKEGLSPSDYRAAMRYI